MDGHGLAKEVEKARHDQLHDLESGHGQRSWTEGKRYNAQCDGKNHYLYKIDKTAINPKTGKGYSKGRIYAGAFEKVRHKCAAYAANWISGHSCGSGRSGDGHGRPEGDGDGERETLPRVRPVRWQDLPVAND